jgi:beta propeller repeat protein
MRIASAFLLASLASPVLAQSPLTEVSVLSASIQDAVLPALSATGVAFRDYRAGSYGIFHIDLQSGQERLLTTLFFAEPDAAHWGNRVAWIGYQNATQADVYAFDLATNQTTRLTTDAAFQSHPAMHGNLLAWTDYRNAGPTGINSHIYVHDFQTGTSGPVTTTAAHRDFARIWGRRVVWQDYRHAGASLSTAEIYARDLDTGVERRVTTGSAFRAHPAIWEHRIVWEDYRNGPDGDIYLFDLNTNEERAVTTAPGHQGQPAIHGNWVVWVDYRNSPDQGDLYGYDLASGTEHALLVHAAHQEPPRLYGNTVVWQDYRSGRLDLYRGLLASTTTSSDHPAVPHPGGRLAAFPNPFSGAVQIIMPLAVKGAQELAIYDAFGREIRRLKVPAAGGSLHWDGTDAAGRTVPAGAYFLISKSGADRAALRLIRMR